MSACCQKKEPGRVFHWRPPVSAPPGAGRPWVGQVWELHCAVGPLVACLDQ